MTDDPSAQSKRWYSFRHLAFPQQFFESILSSLGWREWAFLSMRQAQGIHRVRVVGSVIERVRAIDVHLEITEVVGAWWQTEQLHSRHYGHRILFGSNILGLQ